MKTIIRSFLIMQTLLLLISNSTTAQTFDWAKSVYANLFGISVDRQGNSFVTGEFSDGGIFDTFHLVTYGIYDICIAKYNPNGNCLWAKHAGGIYSDNAPGAAISNDSIGNSYITGCIYGSATFDTIQLLSDSIDLDIFIAKYDPKGNCLWAKRAGAGYAYGISTDKNGNSYITGSGILNAKYDTYGNSLWVKHGTAAGIAISVDPNGNSYVTGVYDGIATFDTIQINGAGLFIAKYDSNGICLWVKTAETIAYNSGGYGISADKNGNTYVTGYFGGTAKFGTYQLTSKGFHDIFVAKYDTRGKCLWVNQAGGNGVGNDYGECLSIDSYGNSYLSGNFEGTIAFDTIHLTSSGYTNIFIAKYNSCGNCLWAVNVGDYRNNDGKGIVSDAYGTVYCTGHYEGVTSFGKFQLSGGVSFITKLSDTPTPVELSSFTGQNINNSVKLEWTAQTETNNNIFEIERKNPNSSWIRIAEVKGAGTSISPKQYSFVDKILPIGKYYYRLNQLDYNGQSKYSNEIEVNINSPDKYSLEQNFPNPYNPSTTIKYQLPKDGLVRLKVLDILGREVTTLVNENKIAGFYEVNFYASPLPSGIYFYRLEAGQFIQVKKMMLIK
jgi:hypothetical protein